MNFVKKIFEILKTIDFIIDLILSIYNNLPPEERTAVKAGLKKEHADKLK